MIKLIICLACGLGIGVSLLNLRHEQLELRHQNAELHDQINAQQAKLWNQQLQIATFTAPNAISETVKGHHIDMVPRFSARDSIVNPATARPAAADPQSHSRHSVPRE